MTPSDSKAARDLLAFYAETGVDALLGEEPVDRFAAPEAPPAPVRAPQPIASSPAPAIQARAAPIAPPAPDEAAMAAREAAKSAKTLDELRAILERFDGCALKATATRLVFADGNPQSRVMFVGEAPGRDEDIEGLPFVGRSGKLLDRMLAAIDLDRTRAYIANVMPWRPPDNRNPDPGEVAMCIPFLRRHIELAQPRILILLGAVAARHVLGLNDGIMKIRGRWLEYRIADALIPVMPTLHPAYLLRQPAHKKLAWRDLQAVADKLDGLNLPSP